MDRISKIVRTDKKFALLAQEHWDSVAKPIDGMGEFEKILSRIGAIRGNAASAPGLHDGRDLVAPVQGLLGDETARLSGSADDCDLH